MMENKMEENNVEMTMMVDAASDDLIFVYYGL